MICKAIPYRVQSYSGQRQDELQTRAQELCAEHRHQHAGYCREAIEAVERAQAAEAEAYWG